MKRPVFIAALIVLSGIICGINESDQLIKAAAFLAAAAMYVYLTSEVSRADASLLLSLKKCRRVTAVLCVLLFSIGLIRGAAVSHYYNTGESSSFFAYYEPGNPGQFDYALYLKSQGICSKELYEQSRQDARQSGVSLSENGGGSSRRPDAEAGTERSSLNEAGLYVSDKAPAELLADSIRDHCGRILDSSLTEHDAGICKAVLLGDKTSLDGGIRDLYQDAGIAHLLAVSGLHVSMIGAGLYKLLRKRLKLKAAVSTAVVSAALGIYMLVTGSGASVVRAVIMLMLGLIAIVCGRNYCMTSALSLSAAVLALQHPYIIFTSGFQLSFGAVAAISLVGQNVIHRTELLLENASHGNAYASGSGVCAGRDHADMSCNEAKVSHNNMRDSCDDADKPGSDNNAVRPKIRLKKHISRGSRLPGPVSAFIISASIQLVTLPIIAYHFYCFPVYGILLNFIVIPLMAVVLASAISVLAAGTAAGLLLRIAPAVPPVLLKLFKLVNAAAAAPGHYVLKLYEYLCGLSLKLPFASVCIGRPEALQILIYYLLLFALISIWLRPRHTGRLRVLLSAAALAVSASLGTAVLRHYDIRDFETVVLDVGQGDCIYVRNRSKHILIDGGSSSRKNIGDRVIESFLLSEGVDRLDVVAVSHADNDHVNGIEYLLSDESRISIDRLILPEAARDDEAYDELKALCTGSTENAGDRQPKCGQVRIKYSPQGYTAAAEGDFSLICLYPGVPGDDRNRQSLVLLLRKGEFSMLLTGDTTAEDERVFSSDRYMRETEHLGSLSGRHRLTVLKAAHHGSSSSNSEELFDYFRPQSVIVSCGRDNRYGHPHEEIVKRIDEYGAYMLRTDEEGAVTIYVKGNKVDFKCFADNKRTKSKADMTADDG